VAKITAIELENFQTIGKRTVIPIRDLTLMFGPNGAGKSAIFDALDLLKLILSDDWGEDCSRLEVMLNKWSRNVTTENPSKSLGVGIQVFIDKDWGSHNLPYEIYQRLDRIHHYSLAGDGDNAKEFLERKVRFYIKFLDTGTSYASWIISELSISVDNDQILELHPEVPKNYPIAYLYERDWISTNELRRIAKERNIKLEDGVISKRVPNSIGFESSARAWFSKRFEGDNWVEEEIFYLFQQVIDFFKIVITAEMEDTPLVKASRTVPSVRESSSIISGEKYYGENLQDSGYRLEWSPMLRSLIPIINSSEDHWVQICKAVATSMGSSGNELNAEWFDLSTLGRINELLREELFIENGYQLTGEVFCITPIHDLEEYSIRDVNHYPKLVHLFLNDNHLRRLEIEEVGSGIGYVLPVLASLVQDDISLIQQPELHLHPRLQGMLGEAIVKSVENKKYLRAFTIIETHSEHLLLRVMRLIKKSESRKSDVLSPITFDRVSVLYFDPLPNGETEVKRLRLAPDGQLIDRWPGGFFNERFNDIFDE